MNLLITILFAFGHSFVYSETKFDNEQQVLDSIIKNRNELQKNQADKRPQKIIQLSQALKQEMTQLTTNKSSRREMLARPTGQTEEIKPQAKTDQVKTSLSQAEKKPQSSIESIDLNQFESELKSKDKEIKKMLKKRRR